MTEIPPEAVAVRGYLRLHFEHDGQDQVVSVPALVQPEVFRELRGQTLNVSWLELVRG